MALIETSSANLSKNSQYCITNCELVEHNSVCEFTTVCVHLGWVKCRAQIPSITILGRMSRHFVTLHLCVTNDLISIFG